MCPHFYENYTDMPRRTKNGLKFTILQSTENQPTARKPLLRSFCRTVSQPLPNDSGGGPRRFRRMSQTIREGVRDRFSQKAMQLFSSHEARGLLLPDYFAWLSGSFQVLKKMGYLDKTGHFPQLSLPFPVHFSSQPTTCPMWATVYPCAP